MYTPKENFIRTVNKDNPDRPVNDWEAFAVIRNDPITDPTRGIRIQGQEIKDIYGTTIIWRKISRAGCR